MADAEPENTRQKHGLWQPGQSGNPAGKPKGARNKLGEAFIEALHDGKAVQCATFRWGKAMGLPAGRYKLLIQVLMLSLRLSTLDGMMHVHALCLPYHSNKTSVVRPMRSVLPIRATCFERLCFLPFLKSGS